MLGDVFGRLWATTSKTRPVVDVNYNHLTVRGEDTIPPIDVKMQDIANLAYERL